MAALDGTITMTSAEYRPCYVNDKKALFHRWIDKEEVVLQFNGFLLSTDEIAAALEDYRTKGILPNNTNVEKVKTTLAIVEYEDGTIDEVRPQQIRFADDKINEYAFIKRTV